MAKENDIRLGGSVRSDYGGISLSYTMKRGPMKKTAIVILLLALVPFLTFADSVKEYEASLDLKKLDLRVDAEIIIDSVNSTIETIVSLSGEGRHLFDGILPVSSIGMKALDEDGYFLGEDSLDSSTQVEENEDCLVFRNIGRAFSLIYQLDYNQAGVQLDDIAAFELTFYARYLDPLMGEYSASLNYEYIPYQLYGRWIVDGQVIDFRPDFVFADIRGGNRVMKNPDVSFMSADDITLIVYWSDGCLHQIVISYDDASPDEARVWYCGEYFDAIRV